VRCNFIWSPLLDGFADCRAIARSDRAKLIEAKAIEVEE